jgi:hypothetical protein
MFDRVTLTGTRFSVATVIAALALVACGGDSSAPADSTGGRTGSGGSDGSGGAAPGSGGASGGAAGDTGSSACEHFVPPDERITDFAIWDTEDQEWGDPDATLTGGTFTYGNGNADVAWNSEEYYLDLTVTDEVLGVSGIVAAGEYAGFGFWFGPCVDASAYRGITFTLGGEHGETQLIFQVQTSKNYPIDTENDKGECTGSWSDGCASNEVEIEEVPEEPTVIEVLWGELSGGEPETTVSSNELLGIQWQFNCGDDPCTPNITLDDIAFILP